MFLFSPGCDLVLLIDLHLVDPVPIDLPIPIGFLHNHRWDVIKRIFHFRCSCT